MTGHLDFLNKNMYRKYPLRASTSGLFTNNAQFYQDFIVSAEISTTYEYSKIYISKVYSLNNFVSIVINDYATDIALGSASAIIIEDFQVVNIESFISTISGYFTFGPLTSISKIIGNNLVYKANGLLEDSTIFCFTPPAVTTLVKGTQAVAGNVDLLGSNITVVGNPDSAQLTLDVINTSLIQSNNDLTGSLDNCQTPIITRINTVTPDSDGNIDIYAILPVTISIESGVFSFIPNLTLDQLCPIRTVLTPPTDDSDDYYTNILETQIPEWHTWPQYS